MVVLFAEEDRAVLCTEGSACEQAEPSDEKAVGGYKDENMWNLQDVVPGYLPGDG